MSTESRPAFLRRLARGRKRRRELDLADMGTAFALDEVLREAQGGEDARPAVSSFGWAKHLPDWRFWLGRKSGA
jgi:hypothetical protein